jgi:hypothetical protein
MRLPMLTLILAAHFALPLWTAPRLQAQTCCDPNWCADCASSGGLCRPATCGCFFNTPIIIDVSDSGFHLTSAFNGVPFQFAPDSLPTQTGWTSSTTDNAFLVLDRNRNGRIDNATELFSSYTPQPETAFPNGFRALAEYDKSANGGNGDGMIDSRDRIFGKLLLWIDSNHDGVSQPNELYPLPALGIHSISLDYQFSNFFDQYGNAFRFRARVNEGVPSKAGPWAYDVIFTTQ